MKCFLPQSANGRGTACRAQLRCACEEGTARRAPTDQNEPLTTNRGAIAVYGAIGGRIDKTGWMI
jgi:hypothetical protein